MKPIIIILIALIVLFAPAVFAKPIPMLNIFTVSFNMDEQFFGLNVIEDEILKDIKGMVFTSTTDPTYHGYTPEDAEKAQNSRPLPCPDEDPSRLTVADPPNPYHGGGSAGWNVN